MMRSITIFCTWLSSVCSVAQYVYPEQGKLYKIVSASSGRVLDVNSCSVVNGASLQLFDYNGTTNQQFRIVHTGAFDAIVGEQSGKVLDVKDVSSENGAPIQTWDNNHTENQLWIINQDRGDGFAIVSVHSGKVLDAVNGGSANGTRIQQWDDLHQSNQRWRFAEVSPGKACAMPPPPPPPPPLPPPQETRTCSNLPPVSRVNDDRVVHGYDANTGWGGPFYPSGDPYANTRVGCDLSRHPGGGQNIACSVSMRANEGAACAGAYNPYGR